MEEEGMYVHDNKSWREEGKRQRGGGERGECCVPWEGEEEEQANKFSFIYLH